MKDIVITKQRILTEILYLIMFLLLAEGLNLYAIMKYSTNWNELWKQWLTVCLLGMFLYAVFAAVRVIYRIVCGLFPKRGA